ncbi:MAG: transposase, partial [Firmicutes bacterium]|nr:transposase [Bacillota bacterium]
QPVLSDIKSAILKAPVINDDETPIKVNGKEKSVLGVFTDDLTLLEAHENRKEEAFIAMNILNIYTGTSVHDHNKMHEKFLLSTQSECNFHPLRYAAEQLEIHGFSGIKAWVEMLIEAKEKAEKAKERGLNSLSEKEIEEIKGKYLQALDEWDEEHNKAAAGKKPEYFDESRRLKTRLREFVEDHLRFLSDFRIPFTNNLAERGLRPIKTKQKIGNFRSLTGAQNYCDARSIIDTAIKQKVNVGSIISDIFNGITNVFNFQNRDEKEESKVA